MTDEELRNQITRMIDDINTLSRVSDFEIEHLRAEFPGIPERYLDFLSVFGAGDVGNLQLYSGPIPSGDVYPTLSQELESVVLFADDFQGYCYGFDKKRDFRVVEVSPRGEVDRSVEPDFRKFIEMYVIE